MACVGIAAGAEDSSEKRQGVGARGEEFLFQSEKGVGKDKIRVDHHFRVLLERLTLLNWIYTT